MVEDHIEKLTEDISQLLKSMGLLVIQSEPTLETVGRLVMVKSKLEGIIKLLGEDYENPVHLEDGRVVSQVVP